jgi:hypothetical protein
MTQKVEAQARAENIVAFAQYLIDKDVFYGEAKENLIAIRAEANAIISALPEAPAVPVVKARLVHELGRIYWAAHHDRIDANVLDAMADACLALQSSPPVKAAGKIAVEKVDCVSYESGFREKTDPIWRVEIDGICADFETETAAQNFADAINKRIAPVQTAAVDGEVDWKRVDDALVSCAGLLRALCKDEIGDTCATELEYVRTPCFPARFSWRLYE